MNIREFYELTGGDYRAAIHRFMQENSLEKFARMFLNDTCYRDLESNLSENNVKEAFCAAHTLKGICLNMSFTGFYNSVNEVAEALRNADPDSETDMAQVHSCMEPLRRDYREIIAAVRGLDS